MDKDRVIQQIFDRLDPVLPSDWTEVVFYAEYDMVSYSMEFYVKQGRDYVKCFDLPGSSRSDLLSTFSEIDKVIGIERKDLSDKDLWTNMTMSIQSNGKVRVDYGYDDLTQDSYEYKKRWKRKYLN